jgi:opacity protein-like surface antigen
VKTGLFVACFVLGSAVAASAGAADPAAPVSEKSTAEVKPADPNAPEKKPEVDLDKAPAAEGPKTASERKAATADEFSKKEDSGGSEVADQKFGHGMQVGLRAGIVGGYRMIFRYDKSPFCHAKDPNKGDKDQQKFCGNGAPPALDLALSFGVLDFAEPYLWARFGLGGESSTNTKALTAFGAGARIYTNSDSKFKVFVEPAVGVELEGGAGNPAWKFQDGSAPDYKTDFLFHLGVGPQYDFARAFGAYVNFGLTTGVLRYIHTEVEGSLGVQVRVP